MDARPGEAGQHDDLGSGGSGGAGPPEPQHHAVPDPAATWVPPESPGTARPAWLPPGTRPGEPYGPPPGHTYGAPPPPYGPYDPYGSYGGGGGPYGGQPPYGNPYGAPPPYGTQAGPRKPRMPRWAKIVLVVGVGLYVLGALAQLFDLAILSR